MLQRIQAASLHFFFFLRLVQLTQSMRFRPGRYNPIFLAALMERPVNSASDIDSYSPFACFKFPVNDGSDSFKVHPMIAKLYEEKLGGISEPNL